ncbi:MAG TPA: FtsX-like permease family protein [Rhodanobacteraceae bacterium]
MEIRPILATLRRHRLTVTLLILQVAFTCAIVSNVAFMIVQHVQQMSLPSGLAENQLSVLSSEFTGIGEKVNVAAQRQTDLAALRAIPGVEAAAATSGSLPLNRNQNAYGTCGSLAALTRAIQAQAMNAGCVQPSFYNGGPDLLRTLGMDLVAGRDFRPDEYVKDWKTPPVAIISEALAWRFFHGQNALGKAIYPSTTLNQPVRVVGIVRTLLRPDLRKPGENYWTVIWPRLPVGNSVTYVLRSQPSARERVLQQARVVLLKLDPSRLVPRKDMQTYTEIRAQYFQRDHTMLGLLIASALGLLFVTALGIAGLASFWVGQRTHTIGIRRALGATRGDIVRYFQTENFLIVTGGVVLGVVLAVGLNLLLMAHYAVPRLPLWYLAVGAVALWILGQLAVLAPALRASRVPPVVATRSV